jgi:hypothetical protein
MIFFVVRLWKEVLYNGLLKSYVRFFTSAFGSTHTLNPVSTSTGFCDDWDTENWDADPKLKATPLHEKVSNLACLVRPIF